jgi:hypothetical protein
LSLVVVENFLADPSLERERALKAVYETREHNSLTYRGIAETEDAEQFEKLTKLIGCEKAKIKCYWRRYLEDEENETYIHADMDIGAITGILYLNTPEQCYGGTAFWKYRPYGWPTVPSEAQLYDVGLKNEKPLFDRLLSDGQDEFLWEMIEYVPMEFNRLLLFDSIHFHSRYPKKAFGTTLTDGRLIKLFFITPEKAEVKNEG